MKLLYVVDIAKIFVKACDLGILILFKQNIPKLPVFLLAQLFYIAGGGIIEIFIQLLQVVVQQCQGFPVRYFSQVADFFTDLV